MHYDGSAGEMRSERDAPAGKVRPVPPNALIDNDVYDLDPAITRMACIHCFVSDVAGV